MKSSNKLSNLYQKPIYSYFGFSAPQKDIFDKLKKEKIIQRIDKGLYCFGGIAGELFDKIDFAFKTILKNFNAVEMYYPATIKHEILLKSGYFDHFSFPVEFISCINNKSLKKLKRFKNFGYKDFQTKNALLPACCLPCYQQLSGHNLDIDLLAITTKNRVFRNERSYSNIFRLNEFDQREIIFIGEKSMVMDSLNRATEAVKSFARKLDFTFTLNVSADTFYGKNSDLKSLFQLLTKSKIELRALASDPLGYIPITSINFHGTHFGKPFKILVKNKTAYTGCVSFGIQRWAMIFLSSHGVDIKKWPKF